MNLNNLTNSAEMKKQVNEFNSVKRSDFTVVLSGAVTDEEETMNNEPELTVCKIIGTVYYKDVPVDTIEWELGDDNYPESVVMNLDSPCVDDFEEIDEEAMEEGELLMAEEEEQLLDRYMLKVLQSVHGSDFQDLGNPDGMLENFEKLFCSLGKDGCNYRLYFGIDKCGQNACSN